jgi:hypothetical protein
MERVFYEEKQKFPPYIGWLVVVVSLGMTVPLFRILYIGLVLGEPTDSNPKKIAAILGLMILIMAFVAWLTFSYSLEFQVSREGIKYWSFPSYSKPRFVERSNIVAYEIRKFRFADIVKTRHDMKFELSGYREMITVNGSDVLELVLSGDRKIILGTQSRESTLWAMKKMMDNQT